MVKCDVDYHEYSLEEHFGRVDHLKIKFFVRQCRHLIRRQNIVFGLNYRAQPVISVEVAEELESHFKEEWQLKRYQHEDVQGVYHLELRDEAGE